MEKLFSIFSKDLTLYIIIQAIMILIFDNFL